MERGRFITLEGGDGVGKSTQARRLVARLRAAGHECLATREPGGAPFAERLRTLLLEHGQEAATPLAEALVFNAARADHLAAAILPALERGVWVISDRFADSTRAYQGAAGGIDDAVLRRLEEIVVGPHRPDVTIILDLDPELAEARWRQRAREAADERGGALALDRFEREGRKFQARLRAEFLKIAAEDPGRCRVVDAGRSEDEVAEEVWRLVSEVLAP